MKRTHGNSKQSCVRPHLRNSTRPCKPQPGGRKEPGIAVGHVWDRRAIEKKSKGHALLPKRWRHLPNFPAGSFPSRGGHSMDISIMKKNGLFLFLGESDSGDVSAPRNKARNRTRPEARMLSHRQAIGKPAKARCHSGTTQRRIAYRPGCANQPASPACLLRRNDG